MTFFEKNYNDWIKGKLSKSQTKWTGLESLFFTFSFFTLDLPLGKITFKERTRQIIERSPLRKELSAKEMSNGSKTALTGQKATTSREREDGHLIGRLR